MAKGPITPKWLEQRIVESWESRGRKPYAREVKAEIESKFKPDEKGNLYLSLRKYQAILTEARKQPVPNKPVDRPWNIGISDEMGIHPDATGYLLEIWKRCTVIGVPFTIREAKWAVRLRTALDMGYSKGIHASQQWAFQYATRERAAEVLVQSVDTTDLDAFLAFRMIGNAWRHWEYFAAVNTGIIPSWGEGVLLHDMELLDLTLSEDEMLRTLRNLQEIPTSGATLELRLGLALTSASFRALLAFQDIDLDTQQLEAMRESDSGAYIGKPIDESRKIKTLTADTVYALWLLWVSKTDRWEAMSKPEMQDAAQELGVAIYDYFEERGAEEHPSEPSTPALTKLSAILSNFGVSELHSNQLAHGGVSTIKSKSDRVLNELLRAEASRRRPGLR